MKKNTNFILSLNYLFIILGLYATSFAEENPSEQAYQEQDQGTIQFLKDELGKTQDEHKISYLQANIDFQIASSQNDEAGMLSAQNQLLEFAKNNEHDPFGVRAYTFAGDISAAHFNDYETAQKYYKKAQEIYRKQPNWAESSDAGTYTGIRLGDSYSNLSKYEEAASVWRETFMEYPNSSFAPQIPAKVVWVNERGVGGEEGWTLSRAFFEDVRGLVINDYNRSRIDIEYIYLLNKGASKFWMEPDDFLEILNDILSRYEEGENRFVDGHRETLAQIVQNYKSKEEKIAAQMARQTKDSVGDAVPNLIAEAIESEITNTRKSDSATVSQIPVSEDVMVLKIEKDSVKQSNFVVLTGVSLFVLVGFTWLVRRCKV